MRCLAAVAAGRHRLHSSEPEAEPTYTLDSDLVFESSSSLRPQGVCFKSGQFGTFLGSWS